MADVKISSLPASTTPLAGTEVLPIVQSGVTKQVSIANVTAGRAVSTGALTVVAADATLDNAYSLKGKLTSGTPVGLIQRNSSDQVAIDADGYGTVIGFSGYRLQITSGNATLQNGNFIPNTAGKGVNFTANTPASGMTSQLLNWYEEGTWTPTQGAGLTVVGTFSSGGTYTRIGNIVYCQGYVAGSTSIAFANGGATICGGLPFSATTASPLQVGLGIDANNTVSAAIFAYGSNILSSQSFAATAQFHFSIFYRL